MKKVLIIIDGLSEKNIAELNDMQPLEYAYTPFIDKIIYEGFRTKKMYCPDGREPDSLGCILSILGVNGNLIPKNRAYLEAVAENIDAGEDEVALRCNLVSIQGNKLESFNGEGLTREEMRSASGNIKPGGIKFYHLNEYRNIIIAGKSEKLFSIKDMPPHENIGGRMECLLNQLEGIKELKEFINDNKFSVRGKSYMFYPWGVADKTVLPSFPELFGKSCSCICSADIMKGIAKSMKMDVPVLKRGTGDVDTDLREKAENAINELKTHDTVIVHVNGTDEASHRRDIKGKINFIEKIDKELIKIIYENIENASMIIVSDHQTSSITGRHETGFVDYICSDRRN
ncbi:MULTISPECIES: phosphoglycerate mutase [unclassified Sedimentibacter]|uniref:phosphoglycerate mutase n=1 Tax=unclassified Sedimentibacter TaxID=2649220 RepID=UPI0027DFDB3D|nr:phosphoglycerate mutase [Sedimentibacter sp. MB35-C1]WMJ75773.1 phosphoglycerate mutase [Sedimentibacter sp. MB35-C1]